MGKVKGHSNVAVNDKVNILATDGRDGESESDRQVLARPKFVKPVLNRFTHTLVLLIRIHEQYVTEYTATVLSRDHAALHVCLFPAAAAPGQSSQRKCMQDV